MANQEHGGRRPDAAGDSPAARVELFRKARAVNPAVDLGDFLPPPGSPHRPAVLVELIKLDLEHRAKAGQPTRLEAYLRRFAADLPAAAVPVALLYEEYRCRHRYADAPPVSEYRGRFPGRFEEFRRYAEAHPVEPPPTAPPPAGTVRPSTGGPRPFGDTPAETRAVTRPPSLPPAPPPPATPQPEAAEDGYKTLKLIGRGAYGKVFLGEAPGGVPVAIKQILRGIDHPVGQSEWQALDAMKRLSHPFLIQIHTFWVDRDQLYIVTELADGSLADWIDEAKEKGLPGVPVEKLLPFFEQAAEALDYLHSQKVSHRDVKPQNLLHHRGYAKVADFGLARAHSHQMTNVAHECGTPLFMAPEVWRKKVTFQSDQYSLAATYVAARLGRPLFDTEYMDQLIVKHLEGTPDLSPLPPAEQAVLLKALAKKPEDRYPSCGAFVAALREAVAPPAKPSAAPRRALLAGAVALGCGLAYMLFLLFAGPAPVPPPDLWRPAGWEPAGAEVTPPDRDGRKFHKRIKRRVGDAEVVAVLVPAARPGDPASFYVLENKVTNRVFAAAWQEAEGRPDSALRRFPMDQWAVAGEKPLPGRWREGADDTAGRQLRPEDHPDLPVVKVTAVEAALAADHLGGRLPRYRQWEKAVGRLSDDTRAGPAGDRGPLDFAGLALNTSAPWPVTEPTDDVSVHGVRQLISNGPEWTRETQDGKEFDPLGAPPVFNMLVVAGRSWDAREILTFEKLRTARKPQQPWSNTGEQIGFRVVLEQP